MINRVEKVADLVHIKNVLLSVADKSHLDVLINGLVAVNPEVKFYSTGGTAKFIRDLLGADTGHLIDVSEYTGQPEMQGGLVKTLDFKIYLGLLSEPFNADHAKDLERTSGIEFDMVVVNLYPFAKTVAQEGVTLEDARSNTDIGGPCMLRASAKNFLRVASVCNPGDYSDLIETLKSQDGALKLEQRFEFSKKTFAHTAEYDSAISNYLQTINDPAEFYNFG